MILFKVFWIPKPKNKDSLEETNKQKTKVKPKIHKIWLKPSGLFQKMLCFCFTLVLLFFLCGGSNGSY